MNSAAGVSNILPGAGLEGGMNAVSALNQGSSVNKLRMIGIQVRDSKGYMRDIEAIARDLWRNLNNSKNGAAMISAQDLSYSLQAGNSLDMLMNQYFGSDAVLRQSVISYLFQFAQEKGAPAGGYTSSAGKTILSKSGANPDITQSIGTRYATGYANTQAYTSAGTNGVQMANGVIQALTAATTAISSVAAPLVATTTFMQTLAGAGNGAGGALIGGFAKTLGGIIDAGSGIANAGANVALGAAVAPELAVAPEILIGLAAAGILTAIGGAIGTDITNNVNANQLFGYLKKNGMDDASTIPITSGDLYWKNITSKSNAGNKGTSSAGSKVALDNKTPTSTRNQWAAKLLTKLKYKATPNNIASITSWMAAENTASSGYMGDRNNPLNLKFTYGQPNAGVDSYGIPVFNTEEGGLNATVKQLLSNTKPGDQYYDINQDLKNNASPTTTLAAISKSPWAEGNYGGHITINISADKNPYETAKAVKQVLADIKLQEQAASSRGKVSP